MYKRRLVPPKKAYFLFGPRGTGKSTWIRGAYPNAKIIDLLPSRNALKYEKDPSLLEMEALAQPKNQYIVIDEIQKVPVLTDDVHNLIENHGYKNIIMTGSSARKLKRGAANLLAGRAILRKLFPLTSVETDFKVEPNQILKYGMLPLSVIAASNSEREEYLNTYVQTYLAEEIKAEGLVRNAGSFSRFLEVAALAAGTKISFSGLSRDAGVGRETVRSYFSIFEDTLLGSWLPAYRPRAKIKELASPKFYWFDPGVLNAAAGAFSQPLPQSWDGVLLEHFIHNELSAYMHYHQKKGSLGYWSTPSQSEVDFVWWHGSQLVAIEVKSSKRFKPEFLKGFRSLKESQHGKITGWLIYQGDEELQFEGVHILPVMQFLKRLWADRIF